MCAPLVMLLVAFVIEHYPGFVCYYMLFCTYLSVMSSDRLVTSQIRENITRCPVCRHLRLYWLSHGN